MASLYCTSIVTVCGDILVAEPRSFVTEEEEEGIFQATSFLLKVSDHHWKWIVSGVKLKICYINGPAASGDGEEDEIRW